MFYRTVYSTPDTFSDIVMESDGEYLTSLRFGAFTGGSRNELPVFYDTIRWLDIYFSGKDPGPAPKYRIHGLTPFRSEVIEELLKIPYGQTVTYGKIARIIADRRGIAKMSAQAVGGAVGWNPICLIIPCHRVIGSDGSLTGYGGGLSNKAALLKLEGSGI